MPAERAVRASFSYLSRCAVSGLVLNTCMASSTDQRCNSFVRTSQSLGASKRAILWHVVLPGARMPEHCCRSGDRHGRWPGSRCWPGKSSAASTASVYYTWTSYTLNPSTRQIIIPACLTIGRLGHAFAPWQYARLAIRCSALQTKGATVMSDSDDQ